MIILKHNKIETFTFLMTYSRFVSHLLTELKKVFSSLFGIEIVLIEKNINKFLFLFSLTYSVSNRYPSGYEAWCLCIRNFSMHLIPDFPRSEWTNGAEAMFSIIQFIYFNLLLFRFQHHRDSGKLHFYYVIDWRFV